jgi:hypothetical protein
MAELFPTGTHCLRVEHPESAQRSASYVDISKHAGRGKSDRVLL